MYQEVCFNRGTEAGGGVNVGHSLSPSPPSHFMLSTGLHILIFFSHKNVDFLEKTLNEELLKLTS